VAIEKFEISLNHWVNPLPAHEGRAGSREMDFRVLNYSIGRCGSELYWRWL